MPETFVVERCLLVATKVKVTPFDFLSLSFCLLGHCETCTTPISVRQQAPIEVDSKFNLNAFRLPYGFHRMYRTRLFPVACLDRAQASGALDLRWSTTALVQPSTVSGFLFLSLVLLLARPRVSSGLASSISMRPSRV